MGTSRTQKSVETLAGDGTVLSSAADDVNAASVRRGAHLSECTILLFFKKRCTFTSLSWQHFVLFQVEGRDNCSMRAVTNQVSLWQKKKKRESAHDVGEAAE